MQQTLMQQGVELMLYGMGTVFVFLALLVLATTALSKLTPYFIKAEAVIPAAIPAAAVPARAGNDPQLVAVITAAVHRYRSRQK